MQFWQKIHSLPEEARKILAVFLIMVAAVSLWWLAGGFISSRLAVIATGESPAGREPLAPFPTESADTEPLSPLAGIIDTLKSLRDVIPGR